MSKPTEQSARDRREAGDSAAADFYGPLLHEREHDAETFSAGYQAALAALAEAAAGRATEYTQDELDAEREEAYAQGKAAGRAEGRAMSGPTSRGDAGPPVTCGALRKHELAHVVQLTTEETESVRDAFAGVVLEWGEDSIFHPPHVRAAFAVTALCDGHDEARAEVERLREALATAVREWTPTQGPTDKWLAQIEALLTDTPREDSDR